MRKAWLLMAGLLLASPVAEAGKKGGDEAADTKKDPYAIPEMKPTKIAEFDGYFDRAKAPIESLITSRKRIDMAQGRLATSLGLAETASFQEIVDDYKRKLDGKATVALRKGKLPRFTTADAVPDDAKTLVENFNAALDEFEAAFTTLESVKGELTTLATETAELPAKAPDAAKSAGLSATDTLAAGKNTKTNVTTLGAAKDESEKLATSLGEIGKTLEASFGAAVE